MVRGSKSLYSFFGLVAIASACSSSANDDASATGASGNTAAAGLGGANAGAAGRAGTGGTNAAGAHAGGSANQGGNAGVGAASGESPGGNTNAGEAGSDTGGANGTAGETGTNSGGASTGGTSTGGTSTGGRANGGSGGAATNQLETAYVAGFLGGIYAYSLDPTTGAPTPIGTPIEQQAFISELVVDPSQRFLYMVDQHGALNTFTIGKDGALPGAPTFSTTVTGDLDAFALDPAGRFMYVATTVGTDDFLNVLAIDPDTGEPSMSGTPLAIDAAPTFLALSPNGKFIYLTFGAKVGLGAYRIDSTSGALTAITGTPFGGDTVFRGAIAFTPNSAFLYTTGSDLTNTGAGLNGFTIGADGTPTRIGTELFQSDEFSDPSAKNIAIDPSGKHLYVSEFLGQERVFEFSIDGASGKLTPLTVPEVALVDPYSCAFDPSGRFLYVAQDTTSLSVYTQNADGTLKAIDGSPFMTSVAEPTLAFSTRPAP